MDKQTHTHHSVWPISPSTRTETKRCTFRLLSKDINKTTTNSIIVGVNSPFVEAHGRNNRPSSPSLYTLAIGLKLAKIGL